MIVNIVLGILAILVIYSSVILFKDWRKAYKEGKIEKTNIFTLGIVGFLATFIDTLGIGNYAPLTAAFKTLKLTKDRTIPGTLNVSMTIPGAIEAFIFMTIIKMDPVTLFAMLAAASVGAIFGSSVVSKLPEKKVQLSMSIALVVVALVMLAGQLHLMPVGGNETGLTGVKLLIGVIGNLILGALMCLGIGLYAPCMALVFALGMSPEVAFPIMMGSCAFVMPVASVKFIKEGAYDRKATLAMITFGTVGVFVAAYLVKSLPVSTLKWLVIVVILYTSVVMYKSSKKKDVELIESEVA